MKTFRRISIGAALAALLVTTTALAGSGVGGVFNLGQTNAVNATSTLSGDTAAPQLTVKNTSANSAATALNLSVAAGRTPFKVNSAVKVANLNADQLDGRDSTYFLAKTAKAADADKLDGIDSTGFWKATGNAGTNPDTNFLGTSDSQALELKVNGQRALRLEPAPIPNLIGGFSGNTMDAGVVGSVIAGGGDGSAPGNGNVINTSYDFVGAGYGNRAGISGGGGATAVVGGTGNLAQGGSAFIGAGAGNTASANYSFVGAGASNAASNTYVAVGGGWHNSAGGEAANIGGGEFNAASGLESTVGGGDANTASGAWSAVPGGHGNTASGHASFAAGQYALATQEGSFVWGDRTSSSVSSPAANTFTVRASGGIWLGTTSSPAIASGHFIETSTGGYLSSGGAWTDASDRALKHHFRRVNGDSVLERVARLPIRSWSYKAEQPSVRHIGPTAQDFYAGFGLGLDDKHITTIDEGGVALAAIQSLYRRNRALERTNAALRRVNRVQDARLARLERQVTRLVRKDGGNR